MSDPNPQLSNERIATTDSRSQLSQAEWLEWAKSNLGVDFTGATERVFRQNTAVALLTVQNHAFFKSIDEFLMQCNSEYLAQTGSDLFMSPASVRLEQKSYDSAVNKVYRHNYVRNKRFPKEPREGGWHTPGNWFDKINDLIRGTLVCKYIDGPEFLAARLKKHATSMALNADYTSQQRDEGYYAFHFYVKVPVQLIDLHLQNLDVQLQVELQLTTQLQEILYKITHRFFEETRNQRITDRVAWKWEVTSNRFKAGYLSHTLHLLEAIVMELRDSNSQALEETVPEAYPDADSPMAVEDVRSAIGSQATSSEEGEAETKTERSNETNNE